MAPVKAYLKPSSSRALRSGAGEWNAAVASDALLSFLTHPTAVIPLVRSNLNVHRTSSLRSKVTLEPLWPPQKG